MRILQWYENFPCFYFFIANFSIVKQIWVKQRPQDKGSPRDEVRALLLLVRHDERLWQLRQHQPNSTAEPDQEMWIRPELLCSKAIQLHHVWQELHQQQEALESPEGLHQRLRERMHCDWWTSEALRLLFLLWEQLVQHQLGGERKLQSFIFTSLSNDLCFNYSQLKL